MRNHLGATSHHSLATCVPCLRVGSPKPQTLVWEGSPRSSLFFAILALRLLCLWKQFLHLPLEASFSIAEFFQMLMSYDWVKEGAITNYTRTTGITWDKPYVHPLVEDQHERKWNGIRTENISMSHSLSSVLWNFPHEMVKHFSYWSQGQKRLKITSLLGWDWSAEGALGKVTVQACLVVLPTPAFSCLNEGSETKPLLQLNSFHLNPSTGSGLSQIPPNVVLLKMFFLSEIPKE